MVCLAAMALVLLFPAQYKLAMLLRMEIIWPGMESIWPVPEDNVNSGQPELIGLSSVWAKDIEEVCYICLESFAQGDTVSTLPCKHLFHRPCLEAWLQRRQSC